MKKKQLDTKRLVTISSLIAVAMILSYIESLIPAFTAIPGVKVGLSNIATVFALYTLGWPYAICVSLVRVCLAALLFGNVESLFISFMGAVFALTGMILISRIKLFSTVGVSVVGGVLHNAGQVVAAIIILKTVAIATYIIPLIISGTIAGVVIGLVSGNLVNRIKKYL